MKVLFVSPAATIYGSERSMLALLRQGKFESEVVCPDGGELESELTALGIGVYPLEFGKYSLRQNPLWHLDFLRSFWKIINVSKPDVIVVNLDGNTPLVTLASVLAGIPIVRFSRFEFSPPSRFVDRWCWLRTKAVICPSELVARQVRDWAEPKFHRRIYRFYEVHVSDRAVSGLGTGTRQGFDLGDEKFIGFVGRLHRGKRIETLIELLPIVCRQVPNIRLLIVGGDDGSAQSKAYCEKLRELADRLSVGDAVTFTGYLNRERVRDALASMDVFVLPSESESFGMVLIEAWAEGIPTVASEVGGCIEITQASGGGLLAPVGDVSTFAQHVVSLLTNSQDADEIGRRGKAWVSENCDPEKYADRFHSILKELVSGT